MTEATGTPPLIGGRYALDARIGAGASGEVFDAEDTHTGERVALKLVFPHLCSSDDNLERFRRQCRLLSGLRHPGVVRIYDWGYCEARSSLFLSMEKLSGETLSQTLSNPRLTTARVMDLVDAALDGLSEAHACGLVHRDIKPDNVFVTWDPAPSAKLIDFGLVRQVDATGPTLTQVGMGTPSYMAPEQATSARKVTYSADVWSVGVVLYRAVSGRLPFTGDGPYETMMRVVSHAAPALPGVPNPLVDVISRCLDKQAGTRFQDAGALRVALVEARAHPEVACWLEGVHHLPLVEQGSDASSSFGSPMDFLPIEPTVPSVKASATPTRKGSRRWGIAALGLLAALVGASALIGPRLRPEVTPAPPSGVRGTTAAPNAAGALPGPEVAQPAPAAPERASSSGPEPSPSVPPAKPADRARRAPAAEPTPESDERRPRRTSPPEPPATRARPEAPNSAADTPPGPPPSDDPTPGALPAGPLASEGRSAPEDRAPDASEPEAGPPLADEEAPENQEPRPADEERDQEKEEQVEPEDLLTF